MADEFCKFGNSNYEAIQIMRQFAAPLAASIIGDSEVENLQNKRKLKTLEECETALTSQSLKSLLYFFLFVIFI